jgi:hypothetical protein
MLTRHVLYLVNVLVDAFENVIGWIVGIKDSLCLVWGRRAVVEPILGILDYVNRLLRVGERYLQGVGEKLRYRSYFETVVRPMKTRYRELKKR